MRDKMKRKYGPQIKIRIAKIIEILGESLGGGTGIAEKAGINRSQLYGFASRKNKECPSLWHLYAISEATDVSISWIVSGEGDGVVVVEKTETESLKDRTIKGIMDKVDRGEEATVTPYKKVSTCPRCGLPIYSDNRWRGDQPPKFVFACDCRNRN